MDNISHENEEANSDDFIFFLQKNEQKKKRVKNIKELEQNNDIKYLTLMKNEQSSLARAHFIAASKELHMYAACYYNFFFSIFFFEKKINGSF